MKFLVLVFVFAALFGQSPLPAEPALGACSVDYWDEGSLSVAWNNEPWNANSYLATYRLDDLTAGSTLFSSTDDWIFLDGKLYLFNSFSPALDPMHSYKLSGVVCVAYYDGYHTTSSALLPSYLNMMQYLSQVIKSLFGR